MDIEVSGNNNRVAGRDYIELRIKPCPCCQERVIEPEALMCNYCRQKRAEEEAKSFLLLGGMALLLVTMGMNHLRSSLGLEENFARSFTAALVFLVACVAIIWLIVDWWRRRG